MSLTVALVSAATESGGHDENVLIPPLSELIIGTLAFGLLVAFFFWKIRPQVSKVYQERTDRIEGGLARAEAAQREAQALLEEYRAQLAEARAEAARIRDEARSEGLQITAGLRDEAQREIIELRARADAQLAADRAQIVAQVRREVGDLAVELASKIVGYQVESTTTQSRLIDDFIAALDNSAAGSTAAPVGPGG
ncbi:F0F1 ATP synthase subunit B [Frankia sp. AgPm24]|uniref:ATP synthase subunit b n=1 Tax=Frankia umida TaxID=573489 RepID=A0ABT0JWE6_9ACTN|nr:MULTISPECIES: F0F1 ATP synthase subunit B [Frankia]MCK9875858.1 F0F1 ATP synthase subunit B [Frankia umida]MCK9924152.1 F0F1 ATP synthase subunit B [Frankia sp. AgPm24]